RRHAADDMPTRFSRPRPDAGSTPRARSALLEEALALGLGHAAPDAVLVAAFEGVLEARALDRAGGADGLRAPLPVELLVLPLERGGWVEHRCLRPPAGGLHLPGVVGPKSAHSPELPLSTAKPGP